MGCSTHIHHLTFRRNNPNTGKNGAYEADRIDPAIGERFLKAMQDEDES
jgi:hypothetical protein